MQLKDEAIDADLNLAENSAAEDEDSADTFQSVTVPARPRVVEHTGDQDDDEESEPPVAERPSREAKNMEVLRDSVSKEMWKQYQDYLRNRA